MPEIQSKLSLITAWPIYPIGYGSLGMENPSISMPIGTTPHKDDNWFVIIMPPQTNGYFL